MVAQFKDLYADITSMIPRVVQHARLSLWLGRIVPTVDLVVYFKRYEGCFFVDKLSVLKYSKHTLKLGGITMLDLLTVLERRRAIRRVKKRWREMKVLLFLVFGCILFNAIGLICGVAGFTLQRLGLLPTVTPIP